MPIYKASYHYPLIILKRLPPDERTSSQEQRMLVLDNDGDMAIVNVPVRLVRKMDLELATEEKKNGRPTRVLVVKNGEDVDVGYLPVSKEQQRSFETLTRYYEETGNSKHRMSNAVQSVLERIKVKPD